MQQLVLYSLIEKSDKSFSRMADRTNHSIFIFLHNGSDDNCGVENSPSETNQSTRATTETLTNPTPTVHDNHMPSPSTVFCGQSRPSLVRMYADQLYHLGMEETELLNCWPKPTINNNNNNNDVHANQTEFVSAIPYSLAKKYNPELSFDEYKRRVLTNRYIHAHGLGIPVKDILDLKANEISDTECHICYDTKIGIVLIPCGHVLCQKCTMKLKSSTCPFCSTTIVRKNYLFN